MRVEGQPVSAGTESQHDQQDFQALVRCQLPRLLGLARRLTRDDVEDLVQEALLRAFKAYPTLRTGQAGGRWLQVILVNTYRDRVRKLARSVDEVSVSDPDDFSLFRTIAEEDPFPYSDTLHLDFLSAFGREDVLEVLLRLPEIYRIPLVLCHMEGFATKEIASLCEVPLGTVLARLHRGRKAFEREMWTYAQEAALLRIRHE